MSLANLEELLLDFAQWCGVHGHQKMVSWYIGQRLREGKGVQLTIDFNERREKSEDKQDQG